jgi:hypothetical protein
MSKWLVLIIILTVLIAGFVFFGQDAIAPENINNTTPSPVKEKNITVSSPVSGATVTNPITVTGTARVFENQFIYALRDKDGNLLYENYAMSDAKDAGLFGNYTVKIPIPMTAPSEFIVEVFDRSAMDGSVIDLVRVPVKLATTEKATVEVYFMNNKLDPEISCNKTFPVKRTIYKTMEVAYVALAELLSGPTDKDKEAGYITSIPARVRINSIKIVNGTAYADLNEQLKNEMGGSCRVTAVRSQITDTLKQFSNVKNVVISVNGRTEDILQP